MTLSIRFSGPGFNDDGALWRPLAYHASFDARVTGPTSGAARGATATHNRGNHPSMIVSRVSGGCSARDNHTPTPRVRWVRRAVAVLVFGVASCGETLDTGADRDRTRAERAFAQPADEPSRGILLSLTVNEDGRSTLDPVAMVTPAGLRDPWDSEDDSAFHARYYAPGRTYAVRAAGVPVGEARALGAIEPGCTERMGYASFMASAPLPEDGDGILASDVFPAAAAVRLLRALTPPEQARLAALADSIHASRGMPAAARASGDRYRLLALSVPGTDGPVLVGTFDVRMSQGENRQLYTQMLIAEKREGVYRPAYVFHDRDDGVTGVRSVLDAADLNGDGVPELVARAMVNEGWQYVVLERGSDGWAETYRGGGGGC